MMTQIVEKVTSSLPMNKIRSFLFGLATKFIQKILSGLEKNLNKNL